MEEPLLFEPRGYARRRRSKDKGKRITPSMPGATYRFFKSGLSIYCVLEPPLYPVDCGLRQTEVVHLYVTARRVAEALGLPIRAQTTATHYRDLMNPLWKALTNLAAGMAPYVPEPTAAAVYTVEDLLRDLETEMTVRFGGGGTRGRAAGVRMPNPPAVLLLSGPYTANVSRLALAVSMGNVCRLDPFNLALSFIHLFVGHMIKFFFARIRQSDVPVVGEVAGIYNAILTDEIDLITNTGHALNRYQRTVTKKTVVHGVIAALSKADSGGGICGLKLVVDVYSESEAYIVAGSALAAGDTFHWFYTTPTTTIPKYDPRIIDDMIRSFPKTHATFMRIVCRLAGITAAALEEIIKVNNNTTNYEILCVTPGAPELGYSGKNFGYRSAVPGMVGFASLLLLWSGPNSAGLCSRYALYRLVDGCGEYGEVPILLSLTGAVGMLPAFNTVTNDKHLHRAMRVIGILPTGDGGVDDDDDYNDDDIIGGLRIPKTVEAVLAQSRIPRFQCAITAGRASPLERAAHRCAEEYRWEGEGEEEEMGAELFA